MDFVFSYILGYYLVMKQSQLFTKTRKENLKDEVSKNAQLLVRAGYINKEMAGVYSLLPLGFRAIEKIKQIVREEMDQIGGQELSLSSLQPKDRWEKTTRWSDEVVDVWFKSKIKTGDEVGFAWSHEEAVVEMMRQHIASYRDLPVSVYQFQWKLRNEKRAKSGIMRGREFLMKDMYSLHTSAEDLQKFYDQMIQVYQKIFDRLGIGQDTFVTFASGGAFTKFSHEFQTVCEAGEDYLYIDREKNIGINEEVLEEAIQELKLDRNKLEKVKSAEVGNIFNFGADKARDMKFEFVTEKGESQPVYLGSYGIGITRLLGVITEKFSDEQGLVFPENIAPFKLHLVSLGNDEKVLSEAEKIYNDLQDKNIEVLWDDRRLRAGEKFADSDLLGIPWRVIVSNKTLETGKLELKHRQTGATQNTSFEDLLKIIK